MDTEHVTGLDALEATLKQFGDAAFAASANLINARAETISLDSKQNYVPVDRSTLQGSIHAEAPVIEGNQITNRVVAGGPAADYAEAVHEHLSEHSPASWKAAEASGNPVKFTQGGPKYLEKPFIAGTKDLGQFVADGIRQRLGT